MTVKAILNKLNDKSALTQLTPNQEKQLKKILLDICVDVVEFCDEHEITYMLSGGTALGAVRHKGFIPWDDDIDLNMPREDYNRFLSLFSEAFKGKYDVYAPDGVHKAALLNANISLPNTILEDVFHAGNPIKLGVYLDIIPIENVPDNIVAAKIKGLLSDIFRIAVVSSYYYQCRSDKMKDLFYGNWGTRLIYDIRCFIGFLMSWKSYQWWFVKFDRFVQTKGKTKKVTIPTGRKHYFGEMMNWDVIFPLRKAEFEGRQFNVYGRVEDYLTMLYGDYMQIPSVEKREKHLYTRVKLS